MVEVRNAVQPVAVVERCNQYPTEPDLCWRRQPDWPGQLYMAVLTPSQCGSIKNAAGIGGRTVYFIHWVGNPNCPAGAGALAAPNWELYSVPRSELPGSGVLSVRLIMQGNEQGGADTQVQLS